MPTRRRALAAGLFLMAGFAVPAAAMAPQDLAAHLRAWHPPSGAVGVGVRNLTTGEQGLIGNDRHLSDAGRVSPGRRHGPRCGGRG